MKNIIYILLAISILACKKNAKQESSTTLSDEFVVVKTTNVSKVISAEPVMASGFLASDKEARMAFKTGGVIEKIYVQEGDEVKKGQLLARLNMTEINAQVTQAHEGLNKLERDLKRVTNLYKDSVATLEQLQNVTTGYNLAKQNVEIADFNKNFSDIRATSNGRIIKKIMNEGELIGPGMPVLYMTADGAADWVIKVGVSDKDWARLKEGDAANITIDAYKGETFPARITNKAVSIDPASGLYQTELKFYRLPKQLAYGLFATAKMQPTSTRSYLSVPVDAIIEGNGNQASVFVVENGKSIRKQVQIASISNANILINSGLEENQQVITDGSAYLTDGTSVVVKNN
jgi:membrane fusion protein, multidrug efflux system